MPVIRRFLGALGAALLAHLLVPGLLVAQGADSSALGARLARWVTEHRVVGIAAVRRDAAGSEKATVGVLRAGGTLPVGDSTIFEIGSITKTFTGTLLADMVLKREVALDDPVAKYLPGWTLPTWQGTPITLLDLATHTSGLPSLPDDFSSADPQDPYADYTEAKLVAYLARAQLRSAPGTRYAYSNMGMGLLGQALAARAGQPYEALVRERILTPLGMNDTRIDVLATDAARVASGHSEQLLPVAPWHFPVFAAAGAFRSTLADMLKFADAVRDTTRGPLRRALAFAVQPRRPYAGTDSIGLAWHHLRADGRDVVWHNGGTGGFRTFLGAIRGQSAAVVLANASVSMDPVGVALLRRQPPPPPPMVGVIAEITLPPAALARFVGHYEFSAAFAIDIARDSLGLTAQATGQQPFRIYPSTPTVFFLKDIKAELLFEVDSTGAVSGLVLRQNGMSQPARKVR